MDSAFQSLKRKFKISRPNLQSHIISLYIYVYMDKVKEQPEWGKKCAQGCLIPQRVVVSIMLFFCLICAYTHRVSMSVVITELVVPKNRTLSSNTVCKPEEESTSRSKDESKIEWSEEMQGLILGSFYIGYLITHMPGGILAHEFGAKWVLGGSMIISTLSTILSPISIDYGKEWGLFATRIIMGAAQGVIFPSISTLLANWLPAKERGTLGTLAYSGVMAGTVLSNLGSGLILHSFAWPLCFYIFGATSSAWTILFCLICYSSPAEHPCIRDKEREYLLAAIPPKQKQPKIPWKRLLLSKALFACVMTQIGLDWGYYVMISCLPKYMADVLRFAVRSNGIVTSLPFVAMLVSSILSGILADWLIRTGKLSITIERKLFTLLGSSMPGAFMVAASYMDCDKVGVVAMFVLALFSMGPYYAGQKLTTLDMSPTFAGILMAICNGLGALSGLASPPVIGAMTPNATLVEWRYVYWMTFVILCFSAVIFCAWGTAEIQSYDPASKSQQ